MESHALALLQRVQSAVFAATDSEVPSNDVVMTDGSEEWTEVDVIRHIELFLALCAKQPDLLKQYFSPLFKSDNDDGGNSLFEVYIVTSMEIQRVIRQHLSPLIKSIGMQSPKLLNIIRNFPPGGETLALRILAILTDRGNFLRKGGKEIFTFSSSISKIGSSSQGLV